MVPVQSFDSFTKQKCENAVTSYSSELGKTSQCGKPNLSLLIRVKSAYFCRFKIEHNFLTVPLHLQHQRN